MVLRDFMITKGRATAFNDTLNKTGNKILTFNCQTRTVLSHSNAMCVIECFHRTCCRE